MNDRRYAMLAQLISWSRHHAALLTAPNTLPLRPATWLRDGTPWLSHTAPMPREPYGYAHWGSDQGLVLLRNPWVEKQSYTLTVDPAWQRPVHAVSVYPEPRVYGDGLSGGDSVTIALAPYETLVLSFAPGAAPAGLPRATDAVGTALIAAVTPAKTTMQRVVFEPIEEPLGADYTSLAPPSGTAIEIRTDFTLTPPAGNTRVRVLALLEGKSVPDACGTLTVDGQEVSWQSNRSDAGFVATGAPVPEYWHFLEAAVPESGTDVSLQLTAQDPEATASIWLVADKPGQDTASLPACLPAPERVSLDSVCVLPPTPLTDVSAETRQAAPIEKIDGVFLDTLEPVHSKQEWGTLQKNRSVWEKELTIGGQCFRRGLGTHANGEIVYNLEGAYRRFLAWAGPDMATYGSLGFTVIVDGQKRWESGKMVRGDAPRQIDVDITGAKELRLVVDDSGNGIAGDHANWANAQLLR